MKSNKEQLLKVFLNVYKEKELPIFAPTMTNQSCRIADARKHDESTKKLYFPSYDRSQFGFTY